MLESIKHETEITIEDVPLQWLSMLKLFDPYLPQYPMMYVHIKKDSLRIYGFPLNINVQDIKGNRCTLKVLFLSNIKLDESNKGLVKDELMERIGIRNKVTLDDIKTGSKNKEQRLFLEELWKKFIDRAYGNELPFGSFYDNFLTFIRCSAAFNPMSGAKSEFQMLYDFMRFYGESVEIVDKFNYLEFYLLPTYDEIINKKVDFKLFKSFHKLLTATEKIDKLYYEWVEVGSKKVKSFKVKVTDVNGFDLRKGPEFRELTSYLLKKKKIDPDEKINLDFLVDAFNRMPFRAIGFITLLININNKVDFSIWDKDDFNSLYFDRSKTSMLFPKILTMTLQQGFGNEDAIPIDNWISSIYEEPLKISSEEDFINSFEKIGKIERMFWLVAQARKTNMKTLFDLLWCIKYGTGSSTEEIVLEGDVRRKREANPLSCLGCSLKNNCIGFKSISNKRIRFIESKKPLKEDKIKEDPDKFDFVIVTESRVPKFVYKPTKKGWILIDAFTGYEIHQKKIKKKSISVSEFIRIF